MEQEGLGMEKVIKKFNADRLLNYLYVLYAFTLPLSRTSTAIATALILLLFLFSPEKKQKVAEIWRIPAARWIVIFVGYYFLSLLITTTPGHTSEEWKEGLRYLVPYLYLLPAVIIAATIEKRYLKIVLGALLAGMMISEVLSYLIFFGVWEKDRSIVSIANPTPFMHHIQYSTFLAITALLLLERIIRDSRIAYRIIYALFFATIVGTLFLINGRTGQVAFLIGLFVLAFAQFQNKLKALLISGLLTLLVIGSAYTLSDNFRERIRVAESDIVKMIENNDYSTSLGYRVGVMILAVPLIQEQPVFGTGVVDTMKLIRDGACHCFADDFWLKRANHMQNQYLQVLVEIGVIGMGIFIMMIYQIARIPLRPGFYFNLKMIFVSVYLFTMLSDIQLHIQFTAGLFAILVGILMAESRYEGTARSEE